MAILRYIPKKNSKFIDRRSEEGGYYEATCEECGRMFYPRNCNARYCSQPCSVKAYKRRKRREKAAAIKLQETQLKLDTQELEENQELELENQELELENQELEDTQDLIDKSKAIRREREKIKRKKNRKLNNK